MTKKSFETSLKKGELGESIVRELLENKGWIVYFPFTKDKAHYFDMLATKNKEKAIALDVKTKARLNICPAQGINIKSYKEYLLFAEKTNIPFWIVFVDDKTGDVHAAELIKLKDSFNPNPKIIAWPTSQMKMIFKLSVEQIKSLSDLDQRNYEFSPK